jgi:hypothetical protein
MKTFLSVKTAIQYAQHALGVVAFLLLFAHDLTAQEIIRSAISSSGKSIQGQSVMLLRHTIGQPSPVTVRDGRGFVLRQGFQQPISIARKDLLSLRNPWDVLIYPNPAMVDPSVEIISGVPAGQIEVTVWNPIGVCVYSERRQAAGAFTIPLAGSSPGQYLIRIDDETQYSVTKKIIIL